jgi:23S rRNA (uracil1939-C5)-methyltransferase
METRQNVLDAEIQIEVESLNYSSYAVGRADGFVIFTSGGVPGDRLLVRMKQIRKNYAVAELVDIISASPHRCHPPCVHFIEGCGGCHMFPMTYHLEVIALCARTG